MSRFLLLQAALSATAIEGLLWGVRSGPGWLLLATLGFTLSHQLRRRLERRPSWSGWLWLASFMFAASTALYDSPVVHVLAPMLCALSLCLAVHHTLARATRVESLLYSPLLQWQASCDVYRSARGNLPVLSGSNARGLILAIPLVSLFGLLFVQADPAYAAQLQSLGLEWQSWAGTALRLLLWTWLAGTLLWTAQRVEPRDPTTQPVGQDDATTWSTALTSVNLLFLSFLAFQGRYLFAGRAPEGLTLAEYARHGFFELFAATLLVLALAVWVHRATYSQAEGQRKAGRAAAVMVTLTFGLVASSALRMHLYIAHFGLTLTRAYVLLTLVGIAATLTLSLVALVRWKHPAWLQSRLVLLGMLSLATVGLTNVEAWVGRVNLARPEVDYGYLSGLSCDLAPALDPRIPAQRQLLQRIVERASLQDWREWNWSQARASLRLQSVLRDNVAQHPSRS